jgi:hypothetical protein
MGALSTAEAVTDAEREQLGRSYAQKWKDSDNGFGDSLADITMTLYDRGGNRSVREMKMGVIEAQNRRSEGDRVLLTFEAPANVKDSRFLIHSMVKKSDLVWLYLPSIKRVKRVASADRSGSFAGSEFSYEDIGSMEMGNYQFSFIENRRCGSQQCAVVRQTPLYPYSGYSFIDVWYDHKHYRQMQIDFYDRKGSPLKTLKLWDYKLYLGQYWRALTMDMKNHVTGKHTVLSTTDVKFQTGLRSQDYEPGKLRDATR